MFTNMSILHRLVFSFAAVLVVSIGTSVLLFVAGNQATQANDSAANASDLLLHLNHAATGHLDQAHTMRGYLLTGAERHARLYDKAVEQFAQSAQRAREAVIFEKDLLGAVDRLISASGAWRAEVGDAVMQNARKRDSAAAQEQALTLAKAPRASELQQGFRVALDDVLGQATARAHEQMRQSTQAMSSIMAIQTIGGFLAVGVSLSAAFWLFGSIALPVRGLTFAMQRLAQGENDTDIAYQDRGDEIGQMAGTVQIFKDAAIAKTGIEAQARQAREALDEERRQQDERAAQHAAEHSVFIQAFGSALERLSRGDLNHRVTEAFAEHYEKLRGDFNRSVAKLEQTLGSINFNAGAINSGSDAISVAVDEMARRTEQQAASLEETAAALDEITATVKKTADGAEHAREVVSTAKQVAENSGAVVRETIQAMGRIEKSSQQIGQIIGVIDEIAFQTNLLALNAGVEAARAGDAGRGFAVVASEVRALAQRSAEAAKQIKGLIATASGQVEQGVEFVDKTGQALASIVSHVVEMNDVVRTIAVGASEQAVSLQQVNAAINEMDRWTQQSATMVEQSVAGAHALAQESHALVRLVSQFRIAETAQAVEAPKPSLIRAVPARRGDGGALRKAEAEINGWSEF